MFGEPSDSRGGDSPGTRKSGGAESLTGGRTRGKVDRSKKKPPPRPILHWTPVSDDISDTSLFIEKAGDNAMRGYLGATFIKEIVETIIQKKGLDSHERDLVKDAVRESITVSACCYFWAVKFAELPYNNTEQILAPGALTSAVVSQRFEIEATASQRYLKRRRAHV